MANSGERKGCIKGKSCGATCIDRAEECRIEASPDISKSLSQFRSIVERIQERANQEISRFKPISTEKEAVKEVEDNYKRWLTGGMEERFYGGPGQRGNPNSKFWLLGQEGYSSTDLVPKNKGEDDPLTILNTLRLHNKLYDVARKEGAKINPTNGIESVLGGKPFHLDKDTTVEAWVNSPGTSYYGRLGKMAQKLGFSGDVLGANVSSFMMAPGQKGLQNTINMLKRNGVDLNTFADGAFKSKEAWYKASVEARLPLMMKGIKRYKPEVVYISQTSSPDEKKFSNMLMYTAAKKFNLPVYNIDHNGWNYTYMIVPLPGGKQTLVMNSWHPQGLRSGPGRPLQGAGAVNREVDYATKLIESLKGTGKPPEGEVAKKVSKDTMDSVLSSTGNARVARPKAAAAASKATPKVETPKQDANAARQKLAGYVQTLRNQGQKDVQIRQALGKMGIPTSLISELV